MRAHGLSDQALADECGVSCTTLLRALDEHPAFALEMNRARSENLLRVAECVYSIGLGGKTLKTVIQTEDGKGNIISRQKKVQETAPNLEACKIILQGAGILQSSPLVEVDITQQAEKIKQDLGLIERSNNDKIENIWKVN